MKGRREDKTEKNLFLIFPSAKLACGDTFNQHE